jgi:H+/Cl- antiporter ClcA
MTSRMWAVTILALLGMAVSLAGIVRVFTGSPFLPLAVVGTASVIIGALAEWLIIEFRQNNQD